MIDEQTQDDLGGDGLFLARLRDLLARYRPIFAAAAAGVQAIEDAFVASLPGGAPQNPVDLFFGQSLLQTRAGLHSLAGIDVDRARQAEEAGE